VPSTNGLPDLGRFRRDGGKAAPFSAIFRYTDPTMCLEMAKKWTRFVARRSAPTGEKYGAGQLAALLLVLALPQGCATNPATGKTDIVLMSEYSEIGKGREMHEQLMADGTAAYDDEKVQAYVNRIGQRVAATSARPDIAYTFTVLDSEDINAFAFPGGYIYINRGLMAYLDNEAELAAVLAHEIGHVTARHAVRQHSAQAANQTLAQLTYILTRSGDLASASNQYGASLVRGYGREHELEADAEGAAYLHAAGYDPDALLEVIGVLKDQEQYEKARARGAGKEPRSYHGLFATHPRNDRRRQKVIRAAGELEPRRSREMNPAEFRGIMEGLAYGRSSTPAQRREDRLYHNIPGFTFAYPAEWTVDRGSKAIVVRAADDSARMTLTIARWDRVGTARDFLGERLAAPRLFQSAPLSQSGLTGHTGVSPASDSANTRRVAVLNRGGLSYLFEGEVDSEGDFETQDARFLHIVESFRPMKRSEREGGKQQYLHYIQAEPATTYVELARGVRIPDAENRLRLLNGQYPSGEPRAGDWVKVIAQ